MTAEPSPPEPGPGRWRRKRWMGQCCNRIEWWCAPPVPAEPDEAGVLRCTGCKREVEPEPTGARR